MHGQTRCEEESATAATNPAPRRHPSLQEAQSRSCDSNRLLAGRNARLSPDLWRRLGEGCWQGDDAADQLVGWMTREGLQHTHPLVARAVRDGIDRISGAPAELQTFFAAIEQPPDWLDAKLLAEGARIHQMVGVTGHYVLRDAGLMPGYLASAINQTLLLTGALQRGARRRMAETMKWWLDCTGDGGLQRGAAGWSSSLHVRLMHAFVRRRVQSLPQWQAAEWGLPVNQTDMAGTYLVFAIVFLLGVRVCGIPLSRDEGRAVIHFWKYLSWLMGVDEAWLVDTEEGARRLLWHIMVSQPEPDESSVLLGRALMDEPLQRPYPHFARLRGHWERQKHLSVTRLFTSRKQMRELGLPAYVLPWYPLSKLPLNLAWHLAHRSLPGGRERLIRQGRAAQESLVRSHFGLETQSMGALHPA